MTVERSGEAAPLVLEVVLGRTSPPATQSFAQTLVSGIIGSYQIPFLIVGLGVLFLRLDDRNA